MTCVPGESDAADPTPDLLGEPFRLDSIIEVPAPEGGQGTWQRYVIVQGTNTINGLRAGTRSEVSLQIESMVERLNERFRKGRTGQGSSSGRRAPPWVSRGGADPKRQSVVGPAAAGESADLSRLKSR